ncbi:MAG: 4Fe-4S binding protein [Deltaproteobacteria bacterium]|nr:4Fe-4S binding protein [Deltaproteobacteria bacterium]
MSEDVYLKLREFLDRLPGGFPATDSGVEIKILKKLFTPEHAHIALKLRQIPQPAFLIAKRIGMEKPRVAEKLEEMARLGLIYRMRVGKRALYMALQFIVGIYEFHVNTLDRELSELLEEYLPSLADLWKSTKTKQLRVVPINSSLDTAPHVSTYDHIRTLVKNKKLISVAPCICQKEQALLGNTCDRPLERCIQFDQAAQYYIENGIGRKISAKELMDLLGMGEEQALVLCPTNTRKIVNICLCCGCCCGILRILKKFPRPADQVQSPFQACIDRELCTSCGTCKERCQIEAIVDDNGVYEVDSGRCIGCGLCVPRCPANALTLVEKPRIAPVPRNMIEMQVRIAKERGVL